MQVLQIKMQTLRAERHGRTDARHRLTGGESVRDAAKRRAGRQRQAGRDQYDRL